MFIMVFSQRIRYLIPCFDCGSDSRILIAILNADHSQVKETRAKSQQAAIVMDSFDVSNDKTQSQ